jgi:homoserine O-acetyltransferase
VAAVVGGSIGGMFTLEWPLCTESGYVKHIIPITTSAYHGAWGISWGEAQRQSIYADKDYEGGWYQPVPLGQPRKGLGAARMTAMLTYRSDISFENRFNRKAATQKKRVVTLVKDAEESLGLQTPPPSDDGSSPEPSCDCQRDQKLASSEVPYNQRSNHASKDAVPVTFAAQSYMQYQAEKFLTRFDANCYIHLTAKMDTHDVTRDRLPEPFDCHEGVITNDDLKEVFKNVPARSLVISVDTDVLFRPSQQRQLAECLPAAKFADLGSSDGHDGFLLEFATLGDLITQHLSEELPWLYEGDKAYETSGCEIELVIDSIFGEAEIVW